MRLFSHITHRYAIEIKAMISTNSHVSRRFARVHSEPQSNSWFIFMYNPKFLKFNII